MVNAWLKDVLAGDAMLVGLELILIGLMVATVAQMVGARSRARVYAWATQGGWEITRCRRCHLFAGGQVVLPGLPVFHVTLRSRSGRERVAIVRSGNLLLGALSDEVAVEWVETTGR